ncbi:MAG: hypothetical protein AAB019_03360 [Planctomycetota bacterium]
MPRIIKNSLAGGVLGIGVTCLLIQINICLTPLPAYHNVDFLVKPDKINYEGVVISDTTGALKEIIIHFTIESAPKILPAYLDLFRSMASDVKVYVACSDQPAFDVLMKEFKEAGILNLSRFYPLIMECNITAWARDRFLAKVPVYPALLAHPKSGVDKNLKGVLMLPPRPEYGCEARINDWFVSWKLSSLFPQDYQVEKTNLYFHGGDLINAGHLMFIDYNLVKDNVGTTGHSFNDFKNYLETKFGKKIILVGDEQHPAPQHHIEMYLTPLNEQTVLVGDPDLAMRLLGRDQDIRDKIDLSEETLARFRNVASCLEEKGFRIIRIPLLPFKDSRVFVSYNNIVMETGSGRSIVYLPRYDVPVLDDYAKNIWGEQGFEVRPIDVSKMYDLGGAIRCLVNVLERG